MVHTLFWIHWQIFYPAKITRYMVSQSPKNIHHVTINQDTCIQTSDKNYAEYTDSNYYYFDARYTHTH